MNGNPSLAFLCCSGLGSIIKTIIFYPDLYYAFVVGAVLY